MSFLPLTGGADHVGAAFRAGSSLLGGLLSRQDTYDWRAIKTSRKMARESLKNLRIAAENAGFNPLTALRATGGQLPSVSSIGGPASMSSSEAVASALGEGVSYWLESRRDPMIEARDQLELDLMREQIATMQHERSPRAAALGAAPVAHVTNQGPREVVSRKPDVSARTPAGFSITVPGRVAEIFGIRDGDLLTGGEVEEIFGDEVARRHLGWNQGHVNETFGSPLLPLQLPSPGWWDTGRAAGRAAKEAVAGFVRAKPPTAKIPEPMGGW